MITWTFLKVTYEIPKNPITKPMELSGKAVKYLTAANGIIAKITAKLNTQVSFLFYCDDDNTDMQRSR